MAIFTYDDTVKVKDTAPSELRPKALGWVVGVYEGDTRKGSFYDQFPPGAVYLIEYEDGSSKVIHETFLEHSGELSGRC